MGIFNFFKKTPVIHDNVFGQLLFRESKVPSRNFFSGKALFAAIDKEIRLLIYADQAVPTQEQKDFYQQLQNSFTEYIQKVKPLIEDLFRNRKHDFQIKAFNAEFTLDALTIPSFKGKPLQWEMMFTTIHDHHYFTVNFKDQEPDGVTIDG